MNVYIAELRKWACGKIIVDCSNCYVTSSIEKMENWLKNNFDFDNREHLWWWVIIEANVDDELGDGGGLHSVYDWDGNLIKEQPCGYFNRDNEITIDDFKKIYPNDDENVSLNIALKELCYVPNSFMTVTYPDNIIRLLNILYKYGYIIIKEPDIKKYIRKKKINSFL